MIVYPYIQNYREYNISIIKYNSIQFYDKLGSGASGVVYKGSVNGEYFCIKELCSENYSSIQSMFNDWLDYEITISQTLSECIHCQSLRYISYRQYKNKVYVYILYDFINAITLSRLINQVQYWTLRETKMVYTLEDSIKHDIIRQLIMGIQELHAKNIVHCDLKLENILYDDQHMIKVIDYGSCCKMENNTSINVEDYNSILGTVGYMAPELHEYNIYYGSDIYSLSICIYELLLGDIWDNDRLSFNKINSYKNSRHVDILNKCLIEDPYKRPTLEALYNSFT